MYQKKMAQLREQLKTLVNDMETLKPLYPYEVSLFLADLHRLQKETARLGLTIISKDVK